MRTLGFLGIIGLLPFNIFGYVFAIQGHDWRGVAIMLFMSAMLIFFATILWRGRRLERDTSTDQRLAEGWAGESVSAFILNQVVKSLEGRVLLAGSAGSLILAALALAAPGVIGITAHRGSVTAMLFAVWPILAFVAYVGICGPSFTPSIFKVIAMLCVVLAPVFIAYR
jgi:hypothetical protein